MTLSQGANAGQKHWDPLTVQQYNPPSNFVDQLNNPSSPIFVDSNTPNTLLMLPPNATNGVESFAAAVGLRPQDLFGICLSIFLMILAGAITLSVLIWIIDHFAANFFGRGDRDERGMGQGPALRSSSNDADKSGITTSEEDGTEQGLLRTTSRPLTLTNALGRSPWHYHYRIRPKLVSWQHFARKSGPYPDAFPPSSDFILVLSIYHRAFGLLRRFGRPGRPCFHCIFHRPSTAPDRPTVEYRHQQTVRRDEDAYDVGAFIQSLWTRITALRLHVLRLQSDIWRHHWMRTKKRDRSSHHPLGHGSHILIEHEHLASVGTWRRYGTDQFLLLRCKDYGGGPRSDPHTHRESYALSKFSKL